MKAQVSLLSANVNGTIVVMQQQGAERRESILPQNRFIKSKLGYFITLAEINNEDLEV